MEGKYEKRKLKFPLIIGLIVCIISIIILIIVLLLPKKPEVAIDPRSFEEIFWDSETSEEAIEIFQKKIDATSDPEEKAKLYTERANSLFDIFEPQGGKKDQILSDAHEAENIESNAESAYFLFNLYSYYNDHENANHYLELHFSRTKEDTYEQ